MQNAKWAEGEFDNIFIRPLSSDLRFALSVDPRILGRAKRRSVFRLIPIQIINPGTEPVKLYKGMKVGNLQQVDDVEMSNPILIPKDSINDVNFQLDHLQPEPKARMEHLLNSPNDMFATSSGELSPFSTSTVSYRSVAYFFVS